MCDLMSREAFPDGAVPEVVVALMANGDALQGRTRLNISLDDTAPESDVPEAFEVHPNLSCQLILISSLLQYPAWRRRNSFLYHRRCLT